LRDREEILVELKGIFDEMFEIDPSEIVPSAKLYDDLDIDSIDAVDLVARLRSITGKKIEAEMFKSVRTIEDVVDAVYRLVNE
jgi:acyl carrier protein